MRHYVLNIENTQTKAHIMKQQGIQNEDQVIFAKWMDTMDWGFHGGINKAALALGKNPRQISRYLDGTTKLSTEIRLAMTALAQGLKPWDPKTEGTPAFHFSIGMGRN